MRRLAQRSAARSSAASGPPISSYLDSSVKGSGIVGWGPDDVGQGKSGLGPRLVAGVDAGRMAARQGSMPLAAAALADLCSEAQRLPLCFPTWKPDDLRQGTPVPFGGGRPWRGQLGAWRGHHGETALVSSASVWRSLWLRARMENARGAANPLVTASAGQRRSRLVPHARSNRSCHPSMRSKQVHGRKSARRCSGRDRQVQGYTPTGRDSKRVSCRHTAQTMRASLLARATAARLWPRRPCT